jgi:hypothetical protein
MDNAQRIRAIDLAIDAHVDATAAFGGSNEEHAIDLLTNLFHWCHAKGIDHTTVIRMATHHFHAEN